MSAKYIIKARGRGGCCSTVGIDWLIVWFIDLFILYMVIVVDFILGKGIGNFLQSSSYSWVMSREKKAKAQQHAGQGRTSKRLADGCHERGTCMRWEKDGASTHRCDDWDMVDSCHLTLWRTLFEKGERNKFVVLLKLIDSSH